MALIPKVSTGDPISATNYNRMVDASNALNAIRGDNGIDVQSAGGLTILRREAMQLHTIATPYPAINLGTVALGSGDLCCIHNSKMNLSDKNTQGPVSIIFGVSLLDTANTTLPPVYAWGIVNEPMAVGKQGSIFVDGMIWVKAKAESAGSLPSGATYTKSRGVSPVDTKGYFHIVPEGLFQIFAEEYTNPTTPIQTDLHWVLIRFEQPRLPLAFLPGTETSGKIPAKPMKQNAAEIGKTYLFDPAPEGMAIPVLCADGRVVLFQGGGGSASLTVVQATSDGAAGVIPVKVITMKADPAASPNFEQATGDPSNVSYYKL